MILKKGNRDQKSKNYTNKLKIKKYRNKMKLNDCYRTKVDSETFAISILTASAFMLAVRIGIANASESTFVP